MSGIVLGCRSSRGGWREIAVKLRLLVLEDDPRWTRAIARWLDSAFEIFGCESVAAARENIHLHWDGFILDECLPDGSGLHFLEELRDAGHRAPVLMMTGHELDVVANHAQRLDAQAIGKPFDEANMHSFARSILARAGKLKMLFMFIAAENRLSPREAEILALALQGRGTDDLPEILGTSANTTRTQVRTLLAKLGYSSLSEAARAILRDLVAEREDVPLIDVPEDAAPARPS
jgi:DNA-binding NarL/FixJ family response regulator